MKIPDGADDWPFEARAAAYAEKNTATDIRKEIDSIVGITDPSWSEEGDRSGWFTKYELVLLLLALGGPQGGDE